MKAKKVTIRNFTVVKALRFGAALLLASAFLGPAYGQRKTTKPLTDKELHTESFFEEGCRFSVLDKNEKALESFRKAADLDPDNSAIHYKIAQTLSFLNRLPEAVDEAKKAVELNGTQPYNYVLLASLYERRSEYEQAAKTYTKLISKVPDQEEYYYPLANIYLQMGKYPDAVKVLDKIEKKYGSSAESARQKQQVYLKMNKLDKAVSEGRKLIELYPDEPRYRIMLAELLWSNNRAAQALPLLKEALQTDPENGYGHLMLYEVFRTQNKPDSANREMQAAFADPELDIDDKIRLLAQYLGGFTNAEERDRVQILAKTLSEIHPADPKAWAIRGDFAGLAGNRREARSYYVKSAALEGTTLAVWEQILKIDVELNDVDSILKHTESAVERYPNQTVFWFYNARARFVKKDYSGCASSYEQARKYASGNAELNFEINAGLGDTYYYLKNYTKSDAAYEQALKLDPSNAYVLNNYSYYLCLRAESTQSLEKALTMSTKLIEVAPEQAGYLDTHAWVLYMLKKYPEAKQFLAKAVGLPGSSGTIVEHYGDVLYKLGQKDLALEQWNKAKALGGEEDPPRLDKKIATRTLLD